MVVSLAIGALNLPRGTSSYYFPLLFPCDSYLRTYVYPHAIPRSILRMFPGTVGRSFPLSFALGPDSENIRGLPCAPPGFSAPNQDNIRDNYGTGHMVNARLAIQ